MEQEKKIVTQPYCKRVKHIENQQEEMKSQLTSLQSSMALIVSLLIGDFDSDDGKNGEKIAQYKCSQQKILQKKDDTSNGESKGKQPLRSDKGEKLISSDNKGVIRKETRKRKMETMKNKI